MACGAKLYQLVVEDEATGKELLSNGQLKKRVTIIPLNKIDASTLSAEKLRNASKAVGDRGQLALELVLYDKEVLVCMYVQLALALVLYYDKKVLVYMYVTRKYEYVCMYIRMFRWRRLWHTCLARR